MSMGVRCVRGTLGGHSQGREESDGGMSDLNDANFWHQRAKDARGNC
jgi:hypothetical protein